jgi:hypothetical protein
MENTDFLHPDVSLWDKLCEIFIISFLLMTFYGAFIAQIPWGNLLFWGMDFALLLVCCLAIQKWFQSFPKP